MSKKSNHKYLSKVRQTGPMSILKYPGLLWPDRFETKMRYQVTFQLTGASGATVTRIFRLNSLYDPDYTGVGVTAYGLSQLSALYSKYLVTRTHVKMDVNNANTTLTNFGWTATDAVTGPATPTLCAAQRYGGYVIISPNSAQGRRLIQTDVVGSAIHGQKNLDSDSQQYATVSSNPSDVSWLYVLAQAADGTTCNLYLDLELIFTCAFKEATF
jgi:hypothetical protein